MQCKYCGGNFTLKKEIYAFMTVEYLECERCKFTEFEPTIVKEWIKEQGIKDKNEKPVKKEEKVEKPKVGEVLKEKIVEEKTIEKKVEKQKEEKVIEQEKEQKKKYKIFLKPEKKDLFEEKTIEIEENISLLLAARELNINIDEKNDNMIIINGECKSKERIIKANVNEFYVVSASSTYPLSDLQIIVPMASLSKSKVNDLHKISGGNNKFKITFKTDVEGKIKSFVSEIDEKTNLLQACALVDININAPCGGRGECEKCKILIEKGDFLNKGKIFDKYVLACQVYPKSDLEVFIPNESIGEKDTSQILMDEIEKTEVKGDVGFAVDIGTTTIVAYLVDLQTNKISDGEGCYNPQRVYGGDVLARMDYAKKKPENRKQLQKLVVNAINKLIVNIIKRRNLNINQIKKYVLSGNVVMTYLFLGKDTEEIRFNPVSENYKKFYSGKARDIGLIGNNETEHYTVPGIGAYVGGDITSDILCSGMLEDENFSMLIDMGTNGQMVVGNKDMLIACSTSAGPAFEGGGIDCGMRASEGAIESVKILEDGKVNYTTIGKSKPKGICGSGLIELLSVLYKAGIINYKGEINRELKNNSVFKDRIVIDEVFGNDKFIVVKAEENDGNEIYISKRDIENLIYAKAAIYTGIYTLTKISGINFESINKFYIAGGFGSSIDFSKAKSIGLFPNVDMNKFTFIGNGSAKGSSLILTSKEKMEDANKVTKISTYIDLASNKLFNEEYVKAVYIPHLELDRFKE